MSDMKGVGVTLKFDSGVMTYTCPARCSQCAEEFTATWADPDTAETITCPGCGHSRAIRWPGFAFKPVGHCSACPGCVTRDGVDRSVPCGYR